MSKLCVSFFQKLGRISQFEICTKCCQIPPTRSVKKGFGSVEVIREKPYTLTLWEKGYWLDDKGREAGAFTNALCWRMNKEKGTVCVYHLRFGKDRPQFLFDFIPLEASLGSSLGNGMFQSLTPYECKEDTYSGSVLLSNHYIQLNWKAQGPKKNDQISIWYNS